MDRQAVFTRISNHLMEQGVPCLSVGNEVSKICCFKNAHGLKCAVGCLVPDEKYDPIIEKGSLLNIRMFKKGKDVYQAETYGNGTATEWDEYRNGSRMLMEVIEAEVGELDDEDITFLQELMAIHDDNDNKLEYRNALEAFAASRGLVFTMP